MTEPSSDAEEVSDDHDGEYLTIRFFKCRSHAEHGIDHTAIYVEMDEDVDTSANQVKVAEMLRSLAEDTMAKALLRINAENSRN